MRAQSREFTCQTVHDCFLFLFELQVHLCGCHGARMSHGNTCRVDACLDVAARAGTDGWETVPMVGC